ncbi:TPM domain-containing protein [Allocoleopsis sp.]|uniref:TPM domain-containing protein n=1 Tax=Allocoleopsis sp. TaxID=3088169 RepID=UPI002FD4235F
MLPVTFTAKRAFWTVCLCLSFILVPLPSYALTVQDVPNPQTEYGGWVTDMAQILSPNTEAKLNQTISELHSQTGEGIAVVTVPETTPAPSVKAFTTKLFNYWDIGRNGVLLLVSKSDRRVEITTGYGIEAILPNTQVSGIIQKEIIPQFRQGDFEDGILAGIKSLVIKLGANVTTLQDITVDTNNTDDSNQQSGYVALGILVITVLVLPSFWYFSSLGRRSDSDNPSESGSGEGSAGSN